MQQIPNKLYDDSALLKAVKAFKEEKGISEYPEATRLLKSSLSQVTDEIECDRHGLVEPIPPPMPICPQCHEEALNTMMDNHCKKGTTNE